MYVMPQQPPLHSPSWRADQRTTAALAQQEVDRRAAIALAAQLDADQRTALAAQLEADKRTATSLAAQLQADQCTAAAAAHAVKEAEDRAAALALAAADAVSAAEAASKDVAAVRSRQKDSVASVAATHISPPPSPAVSTDTPSPRQNVQSNVSPAPTAILTTSLGKHLPDTLPSSVRADVYSFPGRTLDSLRRRCRHYIKNRETVIIIAGGNDTLYHKPHLIVNEFELLIKEVRKHNPAANIIISEISYRGFDDHINGRVINMLNQYIRDRAYRGDHVFSANVCPRTWDLFSKYDSSRTHFSWLGQRYLAKNVAAVIENFQSVPLPYLV